MGDKGSITLVLGGARSGKSRVAEELAAARGPAVTYVATGAAPGPGDPDWAARVAAHRSRRPAAWETVEAHGPDLGPRLAGLAGTVLVDSLGTWLVGWADLDPGPPDPAPADALVEALVARRSSGAHSVVVSEEVGLGVVPATAVGGAFRDALGRLNQAVAAGADRVLLVVAGRTLELGGPG